MADDLAEMKAGREELGEPPLSSRSALTPRPPPARPVLGRARASPDDPASPLSPPPSPQRDRSPSSRASAPRRTRCSRS